MTNYLWASAHQPTEEQIHDLESKGRVTMLKEENAELYNKLCNISLDTNLRVLANELLEYCINTGINILVQPAGSPKFHFVLGKTIGTDKGIEYGSEQSAYCQRCPDYPDIIFAYSKRVSEDIPQADGSMKKVVVFKHEGWV